MIVFSLPSGGMFILPEREHDGFPVSVPTVSWLPALSELLLAWPCQWSPQQPAPDEGALILGKVAKPPSLMFSHRVLPFPKQSQRPISLRECGKIFYRISDYSAKSLHFLSSQCNPGGILWGFTHLGKLNCIDWICCIAAFSQSSIIMWIPTSFSCPSAWNTKHCLWYEKNNQWHHKSQVDECSVCSVLLLLWQIGVNCERLWNTYVTFNSLSSALNHLLCLVLAFGNIFHPPLSWLSGSITVRLSCFDRKKKWLLIQEQDGCCVRHFVPSMNILCTIINKDKTNCIPIITSTDSQAPSQKFTQ